MLKKKNIVAGIGIIGFLGCLIPLILGWEFNYGLNNLKKNSLILSSMNAIEFGYSLVFYVSVLVPLTVEILCDIFSNLFFMTSYKSILSGLLILTLLTTNLVVLFIAVPTNRPGLLIIMFQIRNVICSCAAYSKVLEIGSDAFDSNSVLLLTSSAVGVCLASVFAQFIFNSSIVGILGIMTTVFGAINIICFMFRSLQWINILRKVAYKDMTTNQYICSIYLLMIFFATSGFTFLSAYYNTDIGSNTNTTYLSLYNYINATFIITLTVLHVRMNRREKEVAQETLEEKRMFVRFVSHEVRTPLNTVFLGLKLLRDEINNKNSTTNLLETLKEIQQSCDISLNILNDMLSFEKIESGRLVLEEESLNPKSLLEETIAPFSIQARNLGITLTLTYGSSCEGELDNVSLFADKNKISQVIRNIVSNALKFTRRGGSVTVLVDILPQELVMKSIRRNSAAVGLLKSRKVLRINVIDTGHGISKENIGKLFHQMIQFHAASHQCGGGTGLGLWIAKAIVEKHHGSITAYSDGEGSGCTFTIQLELRDLAQDQYLEILPTDPPPLNDDQSESKSNKESSERYTVSLIDHRRCSVTPVVELNVMGASLVDFFPCHVLVVDDSVSNRKMLVRLIRGKFLSVDEAEDGVEAVAKVVDSLKGEKQGFSPAYDILLMDYMMPNMDGPTAASAIRALGYTGLIIGVTGNALPGDIRHFIVSGANNVLTKPVDMSALMKLISNYFVQTRFPSTATTSTT